MNNVKITKLRIDADLNKGCVLAIGGFDGVHIGHRAMLSSLASESKRLNLPAAVFTFDMTDSPKGGAGLLSLWDEKLLLFAENGVDIVISAPFTAIKDMSACDFAEKLVFSAFGAKSVVCGYDFRFGNGREGESSLIKTLLSPKGVAVVTPSAVVFNETTVSSTHIRALIARGDTETANLLLGRSFCFTAEVIHGRQLGGTLGFPTINQKYPSALQTPAFGVYAVECVVGGERFGGVANIGVKPTVGAETEPICETYLFDYHGDCYGSLVRTELVAFIRGEERFNSLQLLKQQVERDKAAALAILSKRSVK